MGEDVSVIIPAYNESDCILRTLEGLKGMESIKEIIVVDDGSTDSTYKLLKPLTDIKLLKNEYNKGKGSAVRHALDYVTASFVALLDADICESAAEVNKLIQYINPCKKSIIIGRLPAPRRKGGIGIVKGLSGICFKAMTSRKVDSLLSGQRIMPLDFIRNIELPSGFGLEFKITLEAVRKGYEVIEVPVNMRHRETGCNVSGFVHRGKQCIDIINTIRNEMKRWT
ncbi:MAG: glycosyltransferase [Gracilibacteraceae bacterium]|jgi:glycosyltransferase involved in cell wall biosynthesis|nr:glycosyltransferase [Gracilibacteraceae bacterium]